MPAKRCPMCHGVNEDRDWQCQRCGYEFGQPIERARELLHDQLTNAKIALILLLIVDVAVLALPIYAIVAGAGIVIVPGIVTVAFLTRWTVKNAQKISISRQSLRSLDAQEQKAKLPEARALK